ncbi:MAG TPA: hypothetical protein IAB56_03350 [Candidatus Scybalousia intestinigallinarum]|nr:hypothetical protein [Candidatus Scybalousia intestinigallinarum]
MDNIPNLDDLLNYGDKYPYPDLIMSDYFRIDPSKGNDDSTAQPGEEETSLSSEETQKLEENASSNEESQEQEETSSFNEESQGQEEPSSSKEESQEQEETSSSKEEAQRQEETASSKEESQEQEETTSSNEESQGEEETTSSNEESQKQEEPSSSKEESQGQEETTSSNEESQKQEETTLPKDENDFNDLIANYDENNSIKNESKSLDSPSEKLDDIQPTRIYKVFRKLVSLSYEQYQKGTYKYNKKEIIKHYLTNQKFRIIDDLESPTFKPDVYVFDLSPSNNRSLEMYVNAISSVAIKNSLIYLTYNSCILRKLLIKKENPHGIDVSKIANSQEKNYNNIDCTVFTEYRSLYEELKEIRNRKIYIFSDFDISSDISKLSQENPNIVWFSTEKTNHGNLNYGDYFYREYPSNYIGYYIETSGIDDIEKFVLEKNKNKYKRRTV